MVCQCCHKRMPFNLADGSPYFEAVACLTDEPRELTENYLALCPTCAAKWHVANGQTPAVIRQLLNDADGLSIDIMLAGEPVTLRFVELHLSDLRTALTQVAA